MIRGDLSAEPAPTVAIDFDSLVTHPDPVWWQRFHKWLPTRLSRPFDLWVIPETIRRQKITIEAETFGYFLLKKSISARIIVRRPFAAGINVAVEEVLGDFPYEVGHIVTPLLPADQAADIHQYCRGNRALRFFTRDRKLASHLPGSLVRLVDQFDETCLR